ncbi:hypothetical protein Zmor_011828 [Zophobas morio]|uniref:Protein kinase domain-containing protein n=1 Tax=Zophobas morio TaxID=2755281 RepID=A0AA38HJL7_9CUCU|nr:hypothetical protein Zmor_011828 [Zophobas morio]
MPKKISSQALKYLSPVQLYNNEVYEEGHLSHTYSPFNLKDRFESRDSINRKVCNIDYYTAREPSEYYHRTSTISRREQERIVYRSYSIKKRKVDSSNYFTRSPRIINKKSTTSREASNSRSLYDCPSSFKPVYKEKISYKNRYGQKAIHDAFSGTNRRDRRTVEDLDRDFYNCKFNKVSNQRVTLDYTSKKNKDNLYNNNTKISFSERQSEKGRYYEKNLKDVRPRTYVSSDLGPSHSRNYDNRKQKSFSSLKSRRNEKEKSRETDCCYKTERSKLDATRPTRQASSRISGYSKANSVNKRKDTLNINSKKKSPESGRTVAVDNRSACLQPSTVCDDGIMVVKRFYNENNKDSEEINQQKTFIAKNEVTLQENDSSYSILQKPVNLWRCRTIDQFNILSKVGEGSYGQVYKAEDKVAGVIVALKRIRQDRSQQGFPITALREIKILRGLSHLNIVCLKSIATGSKHDGSLNKREGVDFFLVFEYIENDLSGLLHSEEIKFNVPQIRSFMRQLLQGLEYCHSKNILHRDIKGSNILLSSKGVLKIADFGLARYWNQNSDHTHQVITLWYRPPELLLQSNQYGPGIDIWSAGCVLGEMLTAKPLFKGRNELHQLELISRVCGTPSEENWRGVASLPLYEQMLPIKHYKRQLIETFNQHCEPAAVKLLDRLLVLDPERRPSSTEALKDLFFKETSSKNDSVYVAYILV